MKNNKQITFPDVPGFETTIERVPDGVDPMEFLKQRMDDCPLCREARARGEVPVFEVVDAPRPRAKFLKRPRWRTLKRRR